MRALLTIGFLLAAPATASANACPLAVTLEGDATTVAQIAELLGARGIALHSECATIGGAIVRRGDALVIDLVLLDGTSVERTAADAGTAATVIESFVRADIGSTLLAARPVRSAIAPAIVRDEPLVVAKQGTPPARGVHVFGAFESSYGNDRTGWVGAHVGACIMLGPVCAAARWRAGTVVTGPKVWDVTERRGTELLLGIDIPFALGHTLLSPGFAAGIGEMHTYGETRQMRAETGGLRADAHVTFSVPVWRRLALDFFAAADLTQEAHVEWGPEMVPLPPEPRLLLRFGLGLRYEGL